MHSWNIKNDNEARLQILTLSVGREANAPHNWWEKNIRLLRTWVINRMREKPTYLVRRLGLLMKSLRKSINFHCSNRSRIHNPHIFDSSHPFILYLFYCFIFTSNNHSKQMHCFVFFPFKKYRCGILLHWNMGIGNGGAKQLTYFVVLPYLLFIYIWSPKPKLK